MFQEIFEIRLSDGVFVAEKVLRYDTGDQAVMNMAVAQGKKDFLVVAGQDDQCQVYNMKYKLSSPTRSNKNGMFYVWFFECTLILNHAAFEIKIRRVNKLSI